MKPLPRVIPSPDCAETSGPVTSFSPLSFCRHETHLSAFQTYPQASARISRPHGDEERAWHHPPPSRERSQAPDPEGGRDSLQASHQSALIGFGARCAARMPCFRSGAVQQLGAEQRFPQSSRRLSEALPATKQIRCRDGRVCFQFSSHVRTTVRFDPRDAGRCCINPALRCAFPVPEGSRGVAIFSACAAKVGAIGGGT